MRSRAFVFGVATCGTAAVSAAAAPVSDHHHRHAAFGTVVDWRSASHAVTLARPGGTLLATQTLRGFAAGSTVDVRHLRRLGNGTFTATVVRIGRGRRTRLRGVVAAGRTHGGVAIGAVGTAVFIHA